MIGSVLKKVFGTKHEREVKRMTPLVEKINSFEPAMEKLSNEEFAGLTVKLRQKLSAGETIDDILPEAFAAVREVAKRTLNMRHFDVQLIGGMVMHEGRIAEMKTGEGKTLVATLPLYLNGLSGKGAHLVTVNDYLSRRDAQWMGPVYNTLGLSLGIIQHEASYLYDPEYESPDLIYAYLRPVTRQEAYAADITYGTNNEYGFDYLRDNMKFSLEEYVQRKHHYAIVDEVDSILIDEARTPLIISGQADDSSEKYYTIDAIIPGLKLETHYTIDEKVRQAYLTEEGINKVEELLKIENLYDPKNLETLHHVNQALKAHALFKCDVDYVVKDGEIIIVDEFTGRLMPGRRWSEGLHQAVEAKEKVTIENENQTLASVTFQNYFRMYEKLAGMTGTADTEAGEFHSIYNLDVVVVPTNKPLKRADSTDVVYRTKAEKFDAVIEEVKERLATGQPTLVGTITIDDSEKLAKLLKKHKIKHNVLNAKHHESEAGIVAQAGRLGSVTLSTNMAGRGTDIVLGGNPEAIALAESGHDDSSEVYATAFAEASKVCAEEKQKVIELGGLHIIGTERHESRRIDNQLRGRAGRQGDPGSSRFYMALEDDLMRLFGSERIGTIMDKLGMEEGVPIEHGLISKAVENAQKKVEGQNFDIRKHLLEYDDVMNQQREVVYGYRKQMLGDEGLRVMVREFTEEVVQAVIDEHMDEKSHREDWDKKTINEALVAQFGMLLDNDFFEKARDKQDFVEHLDTAAWDLYQGKINEYGEESMSHLERVLMLHTLDNIWKDHLLTMDHLKNGIGLRGYGQQNPLTEYKKEGFALFSDMILRLKSDVVDRLFKVRLERQESVDELDGERPVERNVTLGRGDESAASAMAQGRQHQEKQQHAMAGAGGHDQEHEKQKPVVRVGEKVGRNDPCPCGSGKKYKKCCGK